MRTVNFRNEVLHAVAYKLGLDPEQSNFLSNQAIPIGHYVEEWVRRLYEARDWPEWTVTGQFTPTNHIVSWDASTSVFSANPVQIGRVLRVFLVDPSTTDAPVETDFTLTPNGIHVGYEHGSAVWIKYMIPSPRFTAVQWSNTSTYQMGDVAYSYTTGECYKSKVNNNINHDPATTFSHPPIPHPPVTPPPLPAPVPDITQDWIPDTLGFAERNEILVITMSDASTGTTPTDPPEAGTDFNVQVYDVATDTLLAGVLHTATGSESLAAVVSDLAAQLIADSDLSTFTITNDATTITLENASLFSAPSSSYTIPSEGGPTHLMKVVVTQTYFAALGSASGQPQITRITITDGTTFPGATYVMTATDSGGNAHSVQYTSNSYDSSAHILEGLLLSIEASSDVYWEGVQLTFDPAGITLDMAIKDNASINLQVAPPPSARGGAYWELVPFPKALVEQVVRGAYADLLREWGQDSKADVQEGAVPTETGISEVDFDSMSTPALTEQQRATSRYRT